MVRFVLLAFLYFFLSFLCLCRSVEEPLQPGLEKGNRFPRIKRGQKKRKKKKKKRERITFTPAKKCEGWAGKLVLFFFFGREI